MRSAKLSLSWIYANRRAVTRREWVSEKRCYEPEWKSMGGKSAGASRHRQEKSSKEKDTIADSRRPRACVCVPRDYLPHSPEFSNTSY
jgi:hypothetical protein